MYDHSFSSTIFGLLFDLFQVCLKSYVGPSVGAWLFIHPMNTFLYWFLEVFFNALHI
jgi:hypothetical protein